VTEILFHLVCSRKAFLSWRDSWSSDGLPLSHQSHSTLRYSTPRGPRLDHSEECCSLWCVSLRIWS